MSISRKLFDLIPNISIKNKNRLKILNKAGDIMGRPMPNRLIMGATAIVSQPYIDEHNRRVDKDTARTARNRTIGKIVAGTAVGCVVRELIFKLINSCTNEDISVDRWNNVLTPRNTTTVRPSMLPNRLRNYRTALSTIVAMVVMVGTNIAFDLPLTNKISNALNARDAKKRNKNAAIPKEVYTDVKNKILDTFNISRGEKT